MYKILIGLLVMTIFSGCMSKKDFVKNLKEALKENPDVILKVIEDNPKKFVETLQMAIKGTQKDAQRARMEAQKKQLEETYKNPLQPMIRANEAILGDKNAPLTLIMYSDFECPFCSKGFKTVQELRKKYGKKIRYIYKHLPLSFHAQAKISAKYFEAISLQNPRMAYKFHDEIYLDQGKLRLGESFLKKIAKKVGANMKKLKADLNKESIIKKINEDEAEAKKFGISGTPGFIFNGVPVKGAYPASHFEDIVKELQKRNKLTL